MHIGIIMLIVGLVIVLFLVNVKFDKVVLKRIGIIVGILVSLYGLILSLQPDDFVVYTESTIVKQDKIDKK